MKSAASVPPAALHPLLDALHALPGIEEKPRGIYHHQGVALLQFHEDGAGRFADLRLRDFRWQRHPVNTPGEQARLLLRIWLALPDVPPAASRPQPRTQTRRSATRGGPGAPCRGPR